MKTKKILVVSSIFVLFAVAAVFIALSLINSPKRTFEKNLRAVSDYIFIIHNKYVDDISASADKNSNSPNVTAEIDENVKQYFTDEAYEHFKQSYYSFSSFYTSTSYITQINSFKTEDYSGGQTKFTVALSYEKPNEEKIELVVWGRARSDNDGKIEFWNLMETPNSSLNQIK